MVVDVKASPGELSVYLARELMSGLTAEGANYSFYMPNPMGEEVRVRSWPSGSLDVNPADVVDQDVGDFIAERFSGQIACLKTLELTAKHVRTSFSDRIHLILDIESRDGY